MLGHRKCHICDKVDHKDNLVLGPKYVETIIGTRHTLIAMGDRVYSHLKCLEGKGVIKCDCSYGWKCKSIPVPPGIKNRSETLFEIDWTDGAENLADSARRIKVLKECNSQLARLFWSKSREITRLKEKIADLETKPNAKRRSK